MLKNRSYLWDHFLLHSSDTKFKDLKPFNSAFYSVLGTSKKYHWKRENIHIYTHNKNKIKGILWNRPPEIYHFYCFLSWENGMFNTYTYSKGERERWREREHTLTKKELNSFYVLLLKCIVSEPIMYVVDHILVFVVKCNMLPYVSENISLIQVILHCMLN